MFYQKGSNVLVKEGIVCVYREFGKKLQKIIVAKCFFL